MHQLQLWLKPKMALPFNGNTFLLFILTFLIFNTSEAQLPPGCANDILAPVITPVSSNIRLVLDGTGNRSISLADIATITDNCNPAPVYTLSAANFNCSNRGQQLITVTATDGIFGSAPTPSAVSFYNPQDIAIDGSGNIYVTDIGNHVIRKISPLGVVSTFAGSGVAGFADGIGTNARFNSPVGITTDAAGNVYVADWENNRIRKISPTGVVTTIAGSGIPGYLDGNGTSARFRQPYGVAVDGSGNVYVADTYNHLIRRIALNGDVTTIAGQTNSGSTNGNGASSSFAYPSSLTIDAAGYIYVSDQSNHLIRKISPGGDVTTLAGNGQPALADGVGTSASFRNPFKITVDAEGNLYVADNVNNAIRKISPSGFVTTLAGDGSYGSEDGPGTSAHFSNPTGVCISAAGILYVADGLNHKIRKINTGNIVTTIAGSGTIGFQNGNIGGIAASGNQSSLQIPVTVALDPPLFTSAPKPEITINIGMNCTAPIPDFKSSATATSGCGSVTLTQSPTQGVPAPLGRRPVTIIATDIYGVQSYQTSYIDIVDGTAPVISPVSNNIILPLSADGTRTITLADVATVTDNCNTNPVYTINPTSFNCSTSGSQIITVTASDGSLGTTFTPAAATFNNPFGLDFDVSGNLYIADQRNNKIRKISAAGIVSTLAGNGTASSVNGTGATATFYDPRGIAIDAAGNVYTSDITNHRIRKITPAGVVTTFAGGAQGYANATSTNAQFSSPRGLAIDPQGNLYLADAYNARIRKITPSGLVTTVAGNGNYSSVDGPAATSSFYEPVDVALDASGNIYVVEASGGKIRKISTSGIVTTLAGDGSAGFSDGAGNTAKFSTPQALTVDNAGNIYVADFGNNKIRKITAGNQVSTLATAGYPTGITMGTNGNLFMTDFGNTIKKISPAGVVTTIAGTNTPGAQDGFIGVLSSGNQSTLQIPVTIVGQSTPVFSTTQSNVSVTANASCSATVENYTSAASAVSSCGGAVTITQSPAPGTVITLGITNITLTATDASNNSAVQTFTLMVTDHSAPVITALSANTIINLDANGYRTITAADLVSVTDCNTATVRISPTTFNCTQIGNQTITVEATDGSFGSGPNPAAVSFTAPLGAVLDAAGNIYVADNNQIRKISISGEVTTLAGNGVAASVDGIGTAASFYELHGLAIDGVGNLYTAEFYSRKVRKVTPSGVVTTLAGTGLHGDVDGPAASATFGVIYSVAVDVQGNVFVADASNNKIRKISNSGIVSTYAGSGIRGEADGPAATATFSTPASLAVDNSGNVYVGEQFKIRKITPAGMVSTFVGSNLRGFNPGTGTNAIMERPMGLVFDGAGNLFATQEGAGRILKITPSAEVSAFAGHYGETTINGTGTAATFRSPEGLGIDAAGNLYVADWFLKNIRKISPSAQVTTYAGSGLAGNQNGNIGGITGNFSSTLLSVIVKDNTAPVITPVSGNIIIPLNANGTRTLSLSDVATVIDNCNNNVAVRFSPSALDCSHVGPQTIAVEATDGSFGTPLTPTNATFFDPFGIDTDAAGNIYVCDRHNQKIRKISTNGEVTTLAGSGVAGFADGIGSEARFNNPLGIAVDGQGNVFVGDADNNRIRKITPSGVVTTIAGSTAGYSDGVGANAKFHSPRGMAVDPQGNLYVADGLNSRIRKISSAGVVSTFAGNGTSTSVDGIGTSAGIYDPSDITIDNAGNLYVVELSGNKIRKITPEAVVTTYAGTGIYGLNDGPANAAKFGNPFGLTVDAQGNLYVADHGNGIRKISAAGVVSTLAMVDFSTGIVYAPNGNLYTTDYRQRIRKISLNGEVTIIAGAATSGTLNGNVGGNVYGNQVSKQISVTVTAQSVPTFTTTQTNISLFADNGCNAVLGDYAALASATSRCGGAITITQSPAAGSLLAVGTTIVSLSATNGAGTIVQTFTVTVADNGTPVVSCPPNVTASTNSIHPNQTGWATATDNCTASSNIGISYTDNTSQGCNMIRTWKATDASGNYSTCTQTINIPQMTVSLGQDMFILYGALGYIGCRTLSPVITGGAAPYTYQWSSSDAVINGQTVATISACNTTDVTHSYTLTVTSSNGCTASATIRLTYINISCSNNANNEKVSVCLRPQGNPTNCNTVCVSPTAAQVLINNGSYYGKCLPGCEVPAQSITGNTGMSNQQHVAAADDFSIESLQAFEVKVRNNPTQTSFDLTITSSEKEKILVRVADVLGRTVEVKQNVAAGALFNIGSKYGKGVFFAEIIQGENRKVVKLVKQ